MKKQLFKSILAMLLSSLVLIAACKKHDDDHHNATDTTSPVIVLDQPTSGTLYSFGDNMTIKGTVTDNSLHEMTINVTDSSGGSIFSSAPTVHDLTSYNFNEVFQVLKRGTKATVTIVVEDHSSNKTTKTVEVTILP